MELYDAGSIPYITSPVRIGIEKGDGSALGAQFGPLDAKRRERVESLPLEQFEALVLDLLSFRSVGDLDTWLNRL